MTHPPAVGVVAEYNPLHAGHLRHLALTRRALPEHTLVVCMSGNWVQRGDCAVTDKWTRARWAVQAGCDLVVELPTPFALSSAETFARGAVAVLDAAGVTALSFGAETPDLPRLQALAQALDSPGLDRAIRPLLAQGLSYPAARQRAVQSLLDPTAAAPLSHPNDTLAVEYLRALPVHITPLAIPRTGAHDGPMDPEYPSASALRSLLREGDITTANRYLSTPWDAPLYDLRHLETSILCQLRRLTPEELSGVPDAGDGLAQRLSKALDRAGSLEELYALTQTKRLTLARVRRVVLRAFLGLTGPLPERPAYLRVLALSPRGAAHLAARRAACPLPVITKPAPFREVLAAESVRTDLYQLARERPGPRGLELRSSPFVLSGSP